MNCMHFIISELLMESRDLLNNSCRLDIVNFSHEVRGNNGSTSYSNLADSYKLL